MTVGPHAADPPVRIREVVAADRQAVLAANRTSRSHHAPWVSPPLDDEAFARYLQRLQARSSIGFLILSKADDGVIGVADLNDVVWGAMRGAAIGYYGNAAYAGRGLMDAGIALMLDAAFGPLGLHRIEANIQPADTASVARVRRLGFRLESFSPRFLQIDGDWRDHERWALLGEDWRPGRNGRA